MVDAADVYPLATPSSPQVLHGPRDLPRMRLRKAPVADAPPATSDMAPLRAPERAHDPEPEPDIEPAPTVLEHAAPAPEPRPRVRPNLGQSRRLGLGAPVSRLPEDVVPQDVRDEIQAAYGVDVADVAIRRDNEAARDARDAAATALARGGDEVILPADLGSLDQPHVKGALAHELTHIAQQRLHGTALPDEVSDAGMALEAAARAAEQRFRGDANAPSLAQSMGDEVNQWLSSGLAERDAEGKLVFLPRSRGPSGAQRLPSATATPDFAWQDNFFLEKHGDELIDRGRLNWGDDPAATEQAEATREAEHLHQELIPFRHEKREELVGNAGRAGFHQIHPTDHAPPVVETEPSEDGQIQQLQGEIRDLRQRLKEVDEDNKKQGAVVDTHNKAV
ncbi:MAG: hypothetical protein QOD72_728, partial [Acidimicrobiaceae bacterium]|nr:hypothetical protein [Acidimicrobiaceae bacterium]